MYVIRKTLLFVWNREDHNTDDLIMDKTGVGDPNLFMWAKLSPLVQCPQMGGSYVLVENNWSLFLLMSGRLSTEAVWTCDKVVMNSEKKTKDCCVILFFRWFGSDTTLELSVLGSVVAAVGDPGSVFSVSGQNCVLAEIYAIYLGCGYQQSL